MFVPDTEHYCEGCLYQMGSTIGEMFVPDGEHYCEGCLHQMGSTIVRDVCTSWGALL